MRRTVVEPGTTATSGGPTPLGPGSTIADRYQIVSRLGEGGMGTVYRARHLMTDGIIAIKVLHPRFTASPLARQRFRAEARLAAALHHPNTIRVMDFGFFEDVTGEAAFLAMEYIDGESLADVIRDRGPLAWRVVVAILSQVLDALVAAHEHRRHIVHRDIKPDNIMVVTAVGSPADVHIKLVDFGIASAIDTPTERAGSVVGTPTIMAPEQWRGERVTPRTDLYQVGCCTFQMLAGRPPYIADSLDSMAAAHCTPSPPDLSVLPPEVPDVARAWLLRMLAKDAGDRPPSARAARDALVGSALLVAIPAAADPVEALRILPQPDGPFVGRQAELAILDRHWSSGDRLVTLHGTGGTGKTRLSIEWAKRASKDAAFDEVDIVFVDLSAAVTTDGVCFAVAEALGIQLASTNAIATLGATLAKRPELLLILDNFEQVVDSAHVLSTWLSSAERLRVLLSSRERLQIADERVFRVPPLITADGDASAASALFAARAKLTLATFELADHADSVDQIVRHLDGLPLAIELAAARVRMMTPTTILGHLTQSVGPGEARRFKLLRSRRRDTVERQATMRGAIGWSWELLDDAERATLCQLSVFRGGFDLEMAEYVIDLSPFPDADWATDIVETLVDKSLVVLAETSPDELPRFSIMASIREFAAEMLADAHAIPGWSSPAAEAAVRTRHAEYFAELAEAPFAEGSRHAHTRHNQRRAELDNLVEASRCPDLPAATEVRLATSIAEMALTAAPQALGDEAVARALARADLTGVERARLHLARAQLAVRGGGDAVLRFDEAEATIDALEACVERDLLLSMTAQLRSKHAISAFDLPLARELAERALDHAQRAGHRTLTLIARIRLANALFHLGEQERFTTIRSAIEIEVVRLGDATTHIEWLLTLSAALFHQRQVQAASEVLDELIERALAIGDLANACEGYHRFGMIRLYAEDIEGARARFETLARQARRWGRVETALRTARFLARLEWYGGDLERAESNLLDVLGMSRDAGLKMEEHYILSSLAWTTYLGRKMRKSRSHFAELRALDDAAGGTVGDSTRHILELAQAVDCGELDRAERQRDLALGLTRAAGNDVDMMVVLLFSAQLWRLRGSHDASESAIREATALGERLKGQSLIKLNIALAKRALDDDDVARAVEHHDAIEEVQALVHVVSVEGIRARIALHANQFSTALQHLDSALELAMKHSTPATVAELIALRASALAGLERWPSSKAALQEASELVTLLAATPHARCVRARDEAERRLRTAGPEEPHRTS